MLDCFLECGVICTLRAIQFAQAQRVTMIWLPFFDSTIAHEVAIILQKLFQTRARSVCKLDLRFLRSARSFTPFENVLFSGARRLDHLLASAIKFGEESVAEINRRIINDQRLLVREQILVSAVQRDEPAACALFRPFGPFRPCLSHARDLPHYDAAVED